jgi:electron transfer flavoprotein alpha subunit
MRSINEDAGSNIMKNCDYYVVGDLHEIVPLLTSQLKEVVGGT